MGEQAKQEGKDLVAILDQLNPDHIAEPIRAYAHYFSHYEMKQLRHNLNTKAEAHTYAINQIQELYKDVLEVNR